MATQFEHYLYFPHTLNISSKRANLQRKFETCFTYLYSFVTCGDKGSSIAHKKKYESTPIASMCDSLHPSQQL